MFGYVFEHLRRFMLSNGNLCNVISSYAMLYNDISIICGRCGLQLDMDMMDRTAMSRFIIPIS